MFGKNEKIGEKYFKEAPENSLFVTSRFITIQGEGPYMGMPAFFIRLAKCNLACNFCDAYFDAGDYFTFDQLEDDIERLISEYFNGEIPKYAQHDEDFGWKKQMVLVLTGGEPMLQKNIVPFLERMNEIFEHTQIESNGILLQDIPYDTTLVVSPKCIEKNGKQVKYMTLSDEVQQRADCLKFVIEDNTDSLYHEIPEWAHEWAGIYERPVYISPMNIYNDEPRRAKEIRLETNDLNVDIRSDVNEVVSFWEPGLLNMEANQKNHEYAGKYCMRYGYNLNLQQHLYIGMA